MPATIQGIKNKAEDNIDMFHALTNFPVYWEQLTNKQEKELRGNRGNPLCYESAYDVNFPFSWLLILFILFSEPKEKERATHSSILA